MVKNFSKNTEYLERVQKYGKNVADFFQEVFSGGFQSSAPENMIDLVMLNLNKENEEEEENG